MSNLVKLVGELGYINLDKPLYKEVCPSCGQGRAWCFPRVHKVQGTNGETVEVKGVAVTEQDRPVLLGACSRCWKSRGFAPVRQQDQAEVASPGKDLGSIGLVLLQTQKEMVPATEKEN